VTFVVLKNKETPDTSSDDDFSLPSLPYANVNLVENPDGSRVKTREVANHDGSQTIIDEFFDRDGRKRKQTMRRRWLGFDGSTRDASFSSLDVNGEMMLWVRKTMQTEIVGLRLENRRTHRGQNAIVVSQVFPSGLFARTPLSVGDIVVSINDVDFRFNPDIRKASEVMAKSNNAVMVMATKPSEWIEKRQQRISQSRQLVETFTIDPPRSKAYQFDALAYDDSVFGYNSTKKVSLKDFSASERLGVIIVSQYTRLGVLLVAKEVSSSGRLAALGLRNGDVILSINGVDMKREPDASRAMSLIRNSEKGIEIEYQRLQNLIEEEGIKNIPVDRMESFRPDGTKSIRTETRNPDGSVLVRIEEVGPANPVDTALTSLGSGKDASPDISRISSDTSRGLPRNSSSFEAIATSTSFGQQRSLEPVYVQVNRSKRFQNVGIELVVANGALCVARVSKGGLLFGKPIIPGDTVLEINGQDFRTNPSARRAHAVLSKATTSVSFTIVRTSLLKGMHGEKGLRPSRKKISFNCFPKAMRQQGRRNALEKGCWELKESNSTRLGNGDSDQNVVRLLGYKCTRTR
jgi:membrane-associated protease RseP (regulator of RpoE activity)